jgi:hypothetical protein
MKNFSDTFGNRNRDLPARTTMPQPTAPSHIRYLCTSLNFRFNFYKIFQIIKCTYHTETSQPVQYIASVIMRTSNGSHSAMHLRTSHPVTIQHYKMASEFKPKHTMTILKKEEHNKFPNSKQQEN